MFRYLVEDFSVFWFGIALLNKHPFLRSYGDPLASASSMSHGSNRRTAAQRKHFCHWQQHQAAPLDHVVYHNIALLCIFHISAAGYIPLSTVAFVSAHNYSLERMSNTFCPQSLSLLRCLRFCAMRSSLSKRPPAPQKAVWRKRGFGGGGDDEDGEEGREAVAEAAASTGGENASWQKEGPNV